MLHDRLREHHLHLALQRLGPRKRLPAPFRAWSFAVAAREAYYINWGPQML